MIHLTKPGSRFTRFTVAAFLAIILLAALACGSAAPPVVVETEVVVEKEVIKEVIKEVMVAPPPAKKETIVFSDLNWDSALLQNQIAMYIVKNGYGYPVDTVFGGTIPLQTGLLNGDTQVSMEIWLPNQQDWWNEVIKKASVIPVGKSLDDNWQSAFVVPTYVVEENPDLKTVQDLAQFKDLFVTAESKGKARLVSCVAGWACEKTNADQVAAYGLDDSIELVTPGSSAALFADLEGAYERKEPWLGYLWGPTQDSLRVGPDRFGRAGVWCRRRSGNRLCLSNRPGPDRGPPQPDPPGARTS